MSAYSGPLEENSYTLRHRYCTRNNYFSNDFATRFISPQRGGSEAGFQQGFSNAFFGPRWGSRYKVFSSFTGCSSEPPP